MKIRVISNKDVVKLTFPLFFLVPPNSQAYDLLALLSTFSKDKGLKALFSLCKILRYNYEDLVLNYLEGKLDPRIKRLLEDIHIDIDIVDEREYERRINQLFEKHKNLLESTFLIRKLPDKLIFIVYKTDFIRTFEGFKSPIIVLSISDFDEFIFLRAFLVWYLTKILNLPANFVESLLEYIIHKYKLKLGKIDEQEFEFIIEKFANYGYWLFRSFGDFPRKLHFLKDYDFSKNVWEWILEKSNDNEIKNICNEVLDKIK